MSAEITITPQPNLWEPLIVQAQYDAFKVPITNARTLIQNQTPIGVDGRLKNSWKGDTLYSQEFIGAISNSAPYAPYGIMGRPPGKFPPYGQGTPLEKWASKRRIPPYLVARKIAEKGTERWRAKQNFTGYFGDPSELAPMEGKLKPGSPLDLCGRAIAFNLSTVGKVLD
jgi:hypothetical protein